MDDKIDFSSAVALPRNSDTTVSKAREIIYKQFVSDGKYATHVKVMEKLIELGAKVVLEAAK